VADRIDAHEVGIEAYIYLYPLVTMDVSRRQMTNIEAGQLPGRGPMNTFVHVREFPTAEFKIVVRPNFDTLYSAAFLDLTDGPMIVSTAPDPDARYYELPMYDMWTDAFAVPGVRTTGSGAGAWAVVPPGWNGTLPDGVDRIDAPTPIVWVIGRTQTNGPADYDTVHKIQDAYRLTPLANWGGSAPEVHATIDPSVDMKTPPLDIVNGMSADQFFTYALGLLATHPPHLTDWPMIARMRRIGLVAGATATDLDAATRAALQGVPADALKTISDAMPRIAKVVQGWQMNTDTMGVYGNFYLKRALVAMIGLGANSPEDAVYPLLVHDADGNALNGDNDYLLHFEQSELPPVDAFWSVTMYDGAGFQAPNPLDRFAIGDRDALQYNTDGSLDLYLQNASPGAGKESNWLPAPRGPLGVTMRLYAPKPVVLQGLWAPPAVRKV
jgi:hypothetical protein